VSELAAAGAVGRVTSDGRLVGWLIPASADEQRAEELIAQGKLRPGRPGGLAERTPRPRRTDVPALRIAGGAPQRGRSLIYLDSGALV